MPQKQPPPADCRTCFRCAATGSLTTSDSQEKSTLNCYFVTSVDICLAAFCASCRLLHAAKAPDFRRRAAPRAKALWLRYPPLYTKKQTPHLRRLFFGGQRWIRTTEDRVGRFTVCSLWPLGNLPVTYIV